jgi:MFS family permease
MAAHFNFTPPQRDLFLGAHLAFATGVLSIPVSTAIGLIADIVPSRKTLYALTVALAGVSSLATASMTITYTHLYLARFVTGGCMAGSLPIVFSLLGDYFDATDRDAASSGLTVSMDLGILFGQLFAGIVGPTKGWQYPFLVCGCICIVTALLVQLFVSDPKRGATEVALQELLQSGQSYNRKFTFQRLYDATTNQLCNTLIVTQGFFTNIPWGIIFVFLNDYLSQECGLSIPKATYLLLVFGVGAALGGTGLPSPVAIPLASTNATKAAAAAATTTTTTTTCLIITPTTADEDFINPHLVLTMYFPMTISYRPPTFFIADDVVSRNKKGTSTNTTTPITTTSTTITTTLAPMQHGLEHSANFHLFSLQFSYPSGPSQITYIISRYHPPKLQISSQPLQHVPLTAPTACIDSAFKAWLTCPFFLLLPSGTTTIRISTSPVSSPATTKNHAHDLTNIQWNLLHTYGSPPSTSVLQHATVSPASYRSLFSVTWLLSIIKIHIL